MFEILAGAAAVAPDESVGGTIGNCIGKLAGASGAGGCVCCPSTAPTGATKAAVGVFAAPTAKGSVDKGEFSIKAGAGGGAIGGAAAAGGTNAPASEVPSPSGPSGPGGEGSIPVPASS